jgi:hypothetical protein
MRTLFYENPHINYEYSKPSLIRIKRLFGLMKKNIALKDKNTENKYMDNLII